MDNNNNEDHKDEINQNNNENNHTITLEELNNISVNENNEIFFTLPISENNSNIYSAIETMLEEMQKNSNIFNENYDNNEFISFDIEDMLSAMENMDCDKRPISFPMENVKSSKSLISCPA